MTNPVQTERRPNILTKINTDLNQMINDKKQKGQLPKNLTNLINELNQGTQELVQKKLQASLNDIQKTNEIVKNAQNILNTIDKNKEQDAAKLITALHGFSNALRQYESGQGQKKPAIERGTMKDKNF